MHNDYSDLSPLEHKALFEYEEKRVTSQLSKELLAISIMFKDCFNELSTMIEIDKNDKQKKRLQVLNDRVEYLIESIEGKSKELIFISNQIKRIL